MSARNKADQEIFNLAIETEFDRLMERTGGLLRPEDVVETARSPKSPLHSRFTWDDSEAASKYRLAEARALITSFEVVFEERNIKVKALSSLEMDRRHGGGYRWTLETLQRSDLRTELLRTAMRDLEALERRYRHLQELSQVWGAVDEVKETIVNP